MAKTESPPDVDAARAQLQVLAREYWRDNIVRTIGCADERARVRAELELIELGYQLRFADQQHELHRSHRRGGTVTAEQRRKDPEYQKAVKRICKEAKRYAESEDLQRQYRSDVTYIREKTAFSRGKILRSLGRTK